MGFDSIWHWIVLLVVVLLIFGTKKIRNLGPDIGSAVRGFKKAMHGDDEEEAKAKEKAAAEKLQADPPASTQSATQEQRDSTESK